MTPHAERGRVLIAADDRDLPELEDLFTRGSGNDWMVVGANSFEQARFLAQRTPCDVLLLDDGLYRRNPDALSWLSGPEQPPVLLLAEPDAEWIRQALRQGAHYWVPRELALRESALLHALLHQAADYGEVRRRARTAEEALQDSRQQVGRLVGLLWEVAPGEGQGRWLSPRQVLERLQEEVARAQRHGGPLAIVLGEVQAADGRLTAGQTQQVAAWTANQVAHARRRCDVAGQYGPAGFLIVLPRTADAGAAGLCRRLQGLLERPAVPAPFGPLSACFGVASYSPALSSVKTLLGRAEERLEQARLGTASHVSF
jgi:GGDEF domain-containing protein